MAKAKPAEKTQSDVLPQAHAGGSYIRDPETGELTRTGGTQPAPEPHEEKPAEPSPAADTPAE